MESDGDNNLEQSGMEIMLDASANQTAAAVADSLVVLPGKNLLSRYLALAVILLGASVLLGWALDNDTLKTILPGFVSMKANTALLFIFAGMALALQPVSTVSGRGKITQICAMFVLAVSILTLIEQLAGVDLKIDELLFTDPDTPRDLFPGRMAVATAVTFLLASIALLITPVAVRITRLATLARGLTIGVIVIGALGIIGYALNFEVLYNWYVYNSVRAYGSVALHTAVGFTLLGAGLWATGQAGAWPSQISSEDERIARIATLLLALAAGATGIAGFSTLQSEVERSYGQGLQVALDARVQQISTNIVLRTGRTQIITTRPNLLKHLRLLTTDPGNAEYRQVVKGVMESFIPHGYTAITIALPNGNEVAQIGEFVAAPAVEIPLDETGEATLLWNKGVYLKNRLPLHDEQGDLGVVVAEQFLPNLTATLLKTEAGAKDTIEFQLCRPKTEAFHCFPTRLHTEPLFLPLHVEGPPLLAQRALTERGTGFAVTQDYRGHRVLGAFAHVDPLGLVAVLKVDTNEIYRPISRQFQYTLLFIVLLTVGGTFLVRRQVRPLAAALAEARQTLGDAIEALPDAFAVYDAEGRLVQYNNRFREIVEAATPDVMVPGITFEAIVRAWAERGLIPAAVGRVDDWVKERMETFHSGTWKQGALEAGGRFYQILERRTRPGGTVGVYADVTEHQLAQQAQARLAVELEVSEAQFRQVVEGAPNAMVMVGTSGKIVLVNSETERVFGYQREELLGQPVEVLIPERFRAAHPGHRAGFFANPSMRRMGAGRDLYGLRKDGTEVPVEIGLSPITTTGDSFVLASIVNITKRKILEQQLQRKNEELQTQYLRVQEANRLKSEFLANMSHELRTPLNAIIGFSELMHDGKAGRVSAEQKEYLGDILTSGRHLLQLINDVLDLAKVEAGKMEFHPEPVDLTGIIGEVRDVLRTLMSHKRINVDIKVDTGLTNIVADPAKLKQILYNYLSNAIKFTSEGGRVVIRALPQGEEQYRIEVEDSGAGIREEDMPRLFAEFQQIDSGITKKYQGTGLGLALTKRMVEAQGGEVGARSTFGKGSVFYAVLPRQMAVTLETAPVPTWRAPANAPLLLVVDDDRDDLAWMTRVLEEEGYRTEIAIDGAQAVARCRKKVYDAIVLDLLLPDISGWQVLKMSQEDGLNRTTPVIVVSVLSDAAKGRAMVQTFLTKPVSREALVQALEQAGIHSHAGNRILVVDDDPKALKLAENMLTELGYSVLTATGGEQGFMLLQQQSPDAVVLDLLMPGMSGFEFLEQLYELEGGPKVPVIVWTFKDLTPEENRQLRTQAHAVVAKGDPKGLNSLLEALRKLVPSPGSGIEETKL